MFVAENNIILEYNHPYIKTVIKDNSAPIVQVQKADEGV